MAIDRIVSFRNSVTSTLNAQSKGSTSLDTLKLEISKLDSKVQTLARMLDVCS